MKCWICGAEMTNTVGGCYRCDNCHMAYIDDAIMRYPHDFKSYKKDEGCFAEGVDISVHAGSSTVYQIKIKQDNDTKCVIN